MKVRARFAGANGNYVIGKATDALQQPWPGSAGLRLDSLPGLVSPQRDESGHLCSTERSANIAGRRDFSCADPQEPRWADKRPVRGESGDGMSTGPGTSATAVEPNLPRPSLGKSWLARRQRQFSGHPNLQNGYHPPLWPGEPSTGRVISPTGCCRPRAKDRRRLAPTWIAVKNCRSSDF
jgi:hypothetical protein